MKLKFFKNLIYHVKHDTAKALPERDTPPIPDSYLCVPFEVPQDAARGKKKPVKEARRVEADLAKVGPTPLEWLEAGGKPKRGKAK